MRHSATLLICVLALGAAADEAGSDYAFMPPGGRALLVERLASRADAPLEEVLARSQDREEWTGWAVDRLPELSAAEAETFGAYAALNLPLDEPALAAIVLTGALGEMPADGKDLAIAQCQFCHGLYSGYLSHDRNEVAWRAIYKAPFHAEIPMSEVERDTFAAYSAINMPIAIDKVPVDLRF